MNPKLLSWALPGQILNPGSMPPPFPLALGAQATIWSVIVYFVSGMSLADDGGHFFVFWGIIILTALQVCRPQSPGHREVPRGWAWELDVCRLGV